jgi:hypothetical protein
MAARVVCAMRSTSAAISVGGGNPARRSALVKAAADR